jgi:hypothetical protein
MFKREWVFLLLSLSNVASARLVQASGVVRYIISNSSTKSSNKQQQATSDNNNSRSEQR